MDEAKEAQKGYPDVPEDTSVWQGEGQHPVLLIHGLFLQTAVSVLP